MDSPRPARNPWLVFSILVVVQYLMVLDVSIILVAIPSIQDDLGFEQSQLAWVMDSYILAFAGLMLLGGRIADLFGRRRVLMIGLVLAGLTALGGGLASSPWLLLAARGGQGLAAAIVVPAAMALVTDLFEEGPDRNKALSIFSGIGGIAGSTGTPLGGVLTTVSWHWVFYVNVPIIIAVMIAGSMLLPHDRKLARGGVDLTGALTGTAGLCMFVFAVLRGSEIGWSSPGTLTFFVVAVVLFAVFAVRQLRATNPMIPRILFRLKHIVLGNLVNILTGVLMFGIFFVLTLHLQQDRLFTPLNAALCTLPVTLGLAFGTQIVVRLLGRITPVQALLGAATTQAIGLIWWGLALNIDGSVITGFMIPGAVWALGCGGCIVSGAIVCTSVADGGVRGAASGLVNMTLQVGGAIGVAALSTVAAMRSVAVSTGDPTDPQTLLAGHSWALFGGAVAALLMIPLTLWLLRHVGPPPAPDDEADTTTPDAVAATG